MGARANIMSLPVQSTIFTLRSRMGQGLGWLGAMNALRNSFIDSNPFDEVGDYSPFQLDYEYEYSFDVRLVSLQFDRPIIVLLCIHLLDAHVSLWMFSVSFLVDLDHSIEEVNNGLALLVGYDERVQCTDDGEVFCFPFCEEVVQPLSRCQTLVFEEDIG